MSKQLDDAIAAFQESEAWAYYKDTEKREMAFRAGVEWSDKIRKAPPECVWLDTDSGWEAKCRKHNQFAFTEGGPSDNNFIYCPYCAARIKEGRVDTEDEP